MSEKDTKPEDNPDFGLSDNQKRMVSLIIKAPYINAEVLSKKIDISFRKVKENLKKLKSKGIIARFGGGKGGYWTVAEDYKE